MRKLLPAFAAASLGFAPVLTPLEAVAAPPRLKGERCHFPNVQPGTWVGFFDGYEESISLFTLRDIERHVTVWRCFKSKADCTAWKYWMQTDYDAGPKVTWCRKN